MALSIKNEEADRLARELTAITGESITEAVVAALRERLERQRTRPKISDRVRRMVTEVAAYPILDTRTADQILDYDEQGLPR